MDNPFKSFFFEENEHLFLLEEDAHVIDESFYEMTIKDLMEEEVKKEYMEFWNNKF